MDDILIKYSHIGGIFDALSLGAIILSSERRVVSMNRSAQLITGFKKEDVVGRFCYNFFKDYLCGGRCKFLESGAANEDDLSADVMISQGTGARLSVTKIESPIYDAKGRVVGCIEVFSDRSVVNDLIKRIRFDDLRMKLILDNLDIGVLTVDGKDHVSFFNTMAENITGFARSEVLGKKCGKIFGKSFCKYLKQKQKELGREKQSSNLETRLLTRHGHNIPVKASYMPLKNEKGGVVGGLTTISDLSLKYRLNSVIKEQYTFYDMVGKAPAMKKIFEITPVIAKSSATILIEGPTGTGKDLLARIIHNESERRKKPFVKVNCASLPESLLESEMFGYAKGAFTGAERDKPGRFKEADGGTIFLDEIGDMPLPLQAKLLRVLEDREFYPLGSRKTMKVDIRILSATNRNLEKLIEEGKFRRDIFYRLNVMRLTIPPLKERKSDIPLLIPHILKQLSADSQGRIKEVSKPAMEVLLNHDYPGNVRELENILEHAMIVCQGPEIGGKHLPAALFNDVKDRHVDNSPESGEKEKIIKALSRCNWKRGEAARFLEIDRTTLWRKMKKHNIDHRSFPN